MSAYEVFLLVTLWIAAPAATLYAFFFAFRPWHSNPQGRALALKSWGSALLLDMALLATMWPDYPYREQVRAVAFSLWAVGIVYLLVTLLASPGARAYPPWNWRRSRRDVIRDTDGS